MEQEMTLDLRDLFEIIKKRWKMILSITTASVVIAAILSFFVLTPIYEASTSLIIGKETQATQNGIDYNDLMMYEKLVKTYAEIAKSRTIIEKTISNLNLNTTYGEFVQAVTVSPKPNTQIIELKIQSPDPKDAMVKANELSKVLVEESEKIFPTTNGTSIRLMDNAVIPESPVKPKKVLNIAIAFVLGIMLSLGLVFVLEYMDNTIKTENDVEKYLDLPVIGIIPKELDE